MSEPSLKFRKTPKTPFLAGNFLLAALGAGLVFFGPNPFSVSTVLLVALCLATGGLLSLLPFLLDQFALLTIQRTRFSQAAANLGAIMERSEEILDRLDEADTESNPIRLVSERLPDLVEEKIREAFERSASDADDIRRNILSKVGDLHGLPKDLEKLHDDLRVLSARSATREYLGTGLENLEAKIYRLEVILNEARQNHQFGATEEHPAEETPATPQRENPEAASTDEPPPEPESNRETRTSEDEQPDPPETHKPSPADPQPEPALRQPASRRKRNTEIIVAAFVGIQNGIFLRGNGPGLDREQGLRMEMTGIGEWAWKGEATERFTAELFLNDKDPSSLGSFTVSPGDVLKLNPTFEKDE